MKRFAVDDEVVHEGRTGFIYAMVVSGDDIESISVDFGGDIADDGYFTRDDFDSVKRTGKKLEHLPTEGLCPYCGNKLDSVDDDLCGDCQRRFPPNGQTLSCFI